MYSSELIKGTLKTIILHLLEGQDRMYGYEIAREVELRSEGKIKITEGAMYPVLHKMEADGLLSVELEMNGKRMRKYYRLTQTGMAETASKKQELNDFLTTMSTLLLPRKPLST
jgi:DNA-binding PadR family transcriptional regulator